MVLVFLHYVFEAVVVRLHDQFRVAVKAVAAFNTRDYCLITQRLNLVSTVIWSMFLCLLQNRAHVHLGLKSKQEQSGWLAARQTQKEPLHL